MSKFYAVPLLVTVILGLILSGCAAPAPSASPTPTPSPTPTFTPSPTPSPTQTPTPTPAGEVKPVVLKSASFVARNMFTARAMVIMVDLVKQKSNGRLQIQFLGGPEVTPANLIAEAVRKNVIQMGLCPSAYYDGLVPLGTMRELSELDPEQEDASGAYDYINELHKQAGLVYLGHSATIRGGGFFTLLLKKPITRPQDMAGMKIGAGTTILTPWLKSIGAGPVVIPAIDQYAAIEKGIVDGFSNPLPNFRDLQVFEVTKYIVEHNYFRGAGSIIVNLDVWNKLSPDLQLVLLDSARAAIQQVMNEYDTIQADCRKQAADKGLISIKFTDSDRDWFYKTLYETCWEDNMKRYPEVAAKLRPLLTKK